jgi:hypothetical protein
LVEALALATPLERLLHQRQHLVDTLHTRTQPRENNASSFKVRLEATTPHTHTADGAECVRARGSSNTTGTGQHI